MSDCLDKFVIFVQKHAKEMTLTEENAKAFEDFDVDSVEYDPKNESHNFIMSELSRLTLISSSFDAQVCDTYSDQ